MGSKSAKVAVCSIVIVAAIAYLYVQLGPRAMKPPPSNTVRDLPQEIQSVLDTKAIALLDNTPIKSATPSKVAKNVASRVETAQSGDVAELYSGNGRDRLSLTARNKGAKNARYTLKEGTLFESGSNTVVLLRPVEVEVSPGEVTKIDLQTAATSIYTEITEREFTKSRGWLPSIDPLLQVLKEDQRISTNAAQAAVLAIMENAPLDLFAEFPRLHPQIPEGANEDAFKIATSDIMGALKLIKDAGLSEEQFAFAKDSQLQVEAMIDPDSHDRAAGYYGITPDFEWSYWKSHLNSGQYSTRHYALYGIAQRYPDVALKMLPEWVRERRLRKVYRLSAVRALAMTERSEAISILQKLVDDGVVTVDPDLLKSTRHAINYLEYRATKASDSEPRAVIAAKTADTAG